MTTVWDCIIDNVILFYPGRKNVPCRRISPQSTEDSDDYDTRSTRTG